MYRPNVFPESFHTYPPNIILDQNSCIDNNILEFVHKMFGWLKNQLLLSGLKLFGYINDNNGISLK